MQYNPTLYITNEENTCRYLLGTPGEHPLVVIGINPSTADDTKPDRTIKRVMSFAQDNGFDSFLMLNLYPQRTPYPNELDKEMNQQLHGENLKCIIEILSKLSSPTVLVAWSESIVIRKYLKTCLMLIYQSVSGHRINWIKLGEFTKTGHPRHPLYALSNSSLTDFDIKNYLLKLERF